MGEFALRNGKQVNFARSHVFLQVIQPFFTHKNIVKNESES